ncbi:MAG: DUF86 domain-containing protein [Bacteroidetes bacterium]|jgi:hypothetical protein|nr:DUF86 domain-containing protein [Bacteroidota bacterium]MBT4410199.1 DUF86 domain-containing protein [Bacteroidota bacterium]MBT7093514.1 DUF86 domain-containing protein [Bacteroidota bacterium]MBT7462423.1 DUF86 domain-containing protein [Bacteroidota bacterium]
MNRIAEYIDGYVFADFKKNYKTVGAVIRNFEIIGEAAKSLSIQTLKFYFIILARLIIRPSTFLFCISILLSLSKIKSYFISEYS